jgi:hypothetical protein
MSTPVSPNEAAVTSALDVFLAPELPGNSHPVLESARRDAAETMAHGAALWLGTLGYLIVLEVIGQNVALMQTAFSRKGSEACFMAGAQEFAARPITPKDARALYGLRCSLAHDYGLRSAKRSVRHVFALRQSGPLVEHPAADWTSEPDPLDPSKRVWPTAKAANQTWINVREVGVFVEELIANLRGEHAAGRVAPAPGVTQLDLRDRQFIIT